jgi:serine/threonine-protein kinase
MLFIRPAQGEDAWIGQVIDGRYRVRARVGTGGMAAVYLVEHLRLGKVAAMKILHRALADQLGAIEHFRQEIEAVGRLDHPNIVQTFDCGYVEGRLYLIMEYVRGEDLGVIVRRDGPLPVARAFALVEQICAALDEVHERGVVHCDLKPDNIVCVRRRDGEQAKLLDFGLAKLRQRSGREGAGALLGGTPSYMSPEQVRVEPLDARSDIYSLGATLYRVLTGEVAFEASTPMAAMGCHLTEPLVPPSVRAPALDLPWAADRIVERAMARRRQDRYASAAEMRADLQAALAELAPRALPAWIDDGEFERQLHRRRVVAGLLAAPLAIAAPAMAGWAGLPLLRSRPATVSEREPNDHPALAGPLVRNRAVRGVIGPSHDGRPDFDYYRIPPGAGPRLVTAQVTGVPELDLVLELFDDRGKLVARADAAPAGGGERLGPATIGAGEAFLRVRPVWIEGQTPAHAPQPYALTADWTRARAAP